MFRYNVTIKVQADIQKDWLVWLKEIHIPEVLSTGCFTDAVVHRLLEIDDSDGPTFAVQYTAESKAAYNQYIETFAPALRQKSFDAWGDRFIAFRSVMQVIN